MGLKGLLGVLLVAVVAAASINADNLINVDFGLHSSSSTFGCPDRLGFDGLITGPDNTTVIYRYVWLVNGRSFESKPMQVVLKHGIALVSRTLTEDAAHAGIQAYGLLFIRPIDRQVSGKRIIRFREMCFKGGSSFEEIQPPGFSPPPSPPMIHISTHGSPRVATPTPSPTRQKLRHPRPFVMDSNPRYEPCGVA